MPWTLRDLMSEATSIVGVNDLVPSRVSWYVNQAQRDVANRVQQLEFERFAISSTSSGDDKMFLPTDCERVISLSFDTGGSGRLIPQTSTDYVDNKSLGTQTGEPLFYASYATWVQFYPSPNSAYSLQMRYVARLSEITNLNAIPSLDTRFHQAVAFKATEYVAERFGKTQLADRMKLKYELELREQPSVMAQRQLNRTGMAARVQLTSET